MQPHCSCWRESLPGKGWLKEINCQFLRSSKRSLCSNSSLSVQLFPPVTHCGFPGGDARRRTLCRNSRKSVPPVRRSLIGVLLEHGEKCLRLREIWFFPVVKRGCVALGISPKRRNRSTQCELLVWNYTYQASYWKIVFQYFHRFIDLCK